MANPPPGFGGAQGAAASDPRQTSGACKTPSFNDLANALGTGLAESMDHAAGGAAAAQALLSGLRADGGGLAGGGGTGVARAASVDPHRALSSGGLRVETPDTYSRQSRHSSGRMGSGGDAGGGVDFLHPSSLGLGRDAAGGRQAARQQLARMSADQLASHLDGGGGGTDAADRPTRYTAAMMSAQSTLGAGRSQLVGGDPSTLRQASDAQLRNLAAGLGNPPGLNGLHANLSGLGLGGPNVGALLGGRGAITAVEPASRNGTPAPGLHLASRGNTPALPSGGTPAPPGIAAADGNRARTLSGGAAFGLGEGGLLLPLNAGAGLQNGGGRIGIQALAAVGRGGSQDDSLLMSTAGTGGMGGIATVESGSGGSGTTLPSSNRGGQGGRASAPPAQGCLSSPPPQFAKLPVVTLPVGRLPGGSLQMTVARLHQAQRSLNAAGLNGGNNAGQAQQAVMTGLPAGAIMLAQAPLRPGSTAVPASGEGTPSISRSGTPAGQPGLGAVPVVARVGGVQSPPPPPPPPADPERLAREARAAEELAPFLRDASPPSSASDGSSSGPSSAGTSRGLAILHAGSLPGPDVRCACEAYGSLESFRGDFGGCRGVFFATYYDLRAARQAASELSRELGRLPGGSSATGGDQGGVKVKYCVPLSSSGPSDESQLMLTRLPGATEEGEVSHVLSSFGQVRAVHYQASSGGGDDGDGDDEDYTSYLVEFYDVQDARQALLELEHSNPWGDGAGVRVGRRSPGRRKMGKDLLLLMSGWRKQNAGRDGGTPVSGSGASSRVSTPAGKVSKSASAEPTEGESLTPSPDGDAAPPSASASAGTGHHGGRAAVVVDAPGGLQHHPQQQPQHYYQYQPAAAAAAPQQYQLVVGPDGQYQYVPAPQPVMAAYQPQPQVVYDPASGQHVLAYAAHDQYAAAAAQQQQQYQLQQQYGMAAAAQQQGYGLGAQAQGGVPGQVFMDPTSLQAAQMMQQQQQQQGAAIVGGGHHQPPTQFVNLSRLPSHQEVHSSSISTDRASLGSDGTSKGSGSGGPQSSLQRMAGSGGRAPPFGPPSAGQPASGDQSQDLSLDVASVRDGSDRRTSLMVRNIPNKYTQSMLLAEFAGLGHGPEKMDFFYLPIDFKNRCNRGYAFVNFVETSDIVPFVTEYNDRKWRRFNSEKVCSITYARIQGKAAMVRRFENSALMEKEEAYRPRVFVSSGERKGEAEAFPAGSGSPVR